MTSNAILKHKFIVLLFLIGSISYAQEMRDMTASYNRNELSNSNLTIEADRKPIGCFEYSGYVVSRETGDPIVDAGVELKNSDNVLVATIRTNKTGYYSFTIPCNGKSKIVFFGEGYSKESRIVKTGENLKSPSINNRIYLTPFESLVEKEGSVEKIKVDPIFFDSHKSTTVAWDKMTLDKVLFTMLKFPEIRIKIKSHSNAGGTDVSNSVISYFRTKAARRYLILQGIDPTRIERANGYGTERLENDCTDGLDCQGQESANGSLSDFIIVSN